MTRILITEDDRDIASHLSDFLRSEGFETRHADGRASTLRLLSEGTFSLCLLDVSLADGNGFSLCSEIKADYDIPVIFLTASGDEYSTVTGLEVGADDYIPKPFRPRELVSRIKNVLRRAGKNTGTIKVGDVIIDTVKGTAEKNGSDLFLSALEYRLLLVFINNRGSLLSRSKLLSEIWDMAGEFVNDNTLTVYIKRLRDKLGDDPQAPVIIRTVRGIGYKMD